MNVVVANDNDYNNLLLGNCIQMCCFRRTPPVKRQGQVGDWGGGGMAESGVIRLRPTQY